MNPLGVNVSSPEESARAANHALAKRPSDSLWRIALRAFLGAVLWTPLWPGSAQSAGAQPAAAAGGPAVAGEAAADTAATAPTFGSFRTFTAPAADPAAWPPGPWTPVSVAELREFLRDEVPSDPPPYLERVEYAAVFDGSSLRNGTFRADVYRVGDEPQFFELGPVSIVLSELMWEDRRPAQWGTTPDGRILVHVDRAQGVLTGKWTQRSVPVFSRRTVDLQLPPGMTTRIAVTFPETFDLTTSTGLRVAAEAGEAPPEGWRRSLLDLGRRTRARLSFAPVRKGSSAPIVACDPLTVVAVGPSGLRFSTDLNLDAVEGAMDALILEVPVAFDVHGATMSAAGDELPLAVELLESNDDRQRLGVRLPTIPAGRTGLVRVHGALAGSHDLSSVFEAPQVRVSGALMLSETIRIEVERPLELKEVETSGYRQVDYALTDAQEGAGRGKEQAVFQDARAERSLRFRVGLPELQVSGRVACVADLTEATPVLSAFVSLATRGGAAFSARLRVPAEWDVVDVRPQGTGAALAGWRIDRDPAGADRLLVIEFTGPLPTQLSLETGFIVSARRTALEPFVTTVDPVLAPLDCESLETMIVVRPPPGRIPTVASSTTFQPVDRLSEDWTAAVQALVAIPPGAGDLLLHSTDRQATGSEVMLHAAAARDAADAEVGEPEPPTAEAADALRAAALYLETRVAGETGPHHVHVARYQIGPSSAAGEFRFRLPSDADLIAVRLDGQPIDTLAEGDVVVVPEASMPARSLEIEYRTDAPSAAFLRRAAVPLPECPLSVLFFHWRVTTPADQQLGAVVAPTTYRPVGESTGWLSRLLGPLSPDPGESRFHPFRLADWRSLIDRPTPLVADDPPGDGLFTLIGPTQPAQLSMTTCHRRSVQTASWGCLWGAMLLTVLARRDVFRNGRRWTAALAAVSAVAACAAPLPWGALAGGVVAGSLIGFLLPRQLVRQTRLTLFRPEQNSDWRWATQGSTVVPLLALALWCASDTVGAQETPPADAPPRAAAPEPSTIDVLVPVTPEGTSHDTVHLSAPLADRLARWRSDGRRTPDSLLRSVRYVVDAPTELGVPMEATFEVVILKAGGETDVLLPIREVIFRSADDCTVDGEPARLTPAAGGRGVLIGIPPKTGPTIEPGGPRNGPSPVPAPRVARVSVRFTARIQTDARGSQFRAALPVIVDSQMTLDLPAGEPLQSVVAQGAETSRSPQQTHVDLGAIETLTVRWGGPPATGAGLPPSPVIDSWSLVEMWPLRSRVRALVRANPAADALAASTSQLLLHLPVGAVIRDVRSEGLMESVVVREDDGPVRLELEFREPARGSREVQVDYILPNASPDGPHALPPLDYAGSARTGTQYVGLFAAPGLQLAPLADNVATDAASLLPSDRLTEFAGVNPAWSKPDVVYVLKSAVPLRYGLQMLTANRTATVDESIEIGRGRAAWSLTATVDVEGVAAFEHRFLLDSRLRVDPDSISIVQDGAERLLRTARDDQRLVLFVSGGKLGRQEIRMRGSMPFTSGERTLLPRIQFEEASVVDANLVVTNGSRWRVALFDDAGEILPANSTVIDGTVELGRYSAEQSPFPRQFLVNPGPDSATAESVTELTHPQDGTWMQSTHIRVRGVDGPLRRVVVSLPRDVVPGYSVTPEDALQSLESGPDGSLLLGFLPDARHHGQFELTVTSPIRVDAGASWTQPIPSVESALTESRFVSLPPGAPLVPEGAALVSNDQRPRWIDAPDAPVNRVDREWYRISGAAVTLRQRVRAGAPSLSAALAESMIWSTSDGAWGSTTCCVTARSGAEAVYQPGERLTVRAVELDGSLMHHTPDAAGRIVVPLTPGKAHLLTTWWVARSDDRSSRFRRDLPTLLPAGVQPQQHLVTLMEPAGQPRWGGSNLANRTPAGFWLDRWEGLLEAAESGVPAPLDMDGPWLNRLRACAIRAEQLVQSGTVGESEQARFDALQSRWNRFQESILVDSSLPGEPTRNAAEQGITESAFAWSLAPQAAQATLAALPPEALSVDVGKPLASWDSRTGRLILSVAIVAALLMLARALRHWELPDWLGDRPLLATAFAGWVWWLLFTSSGGGAALLAGAVMAALIRTWRRSRRPRWKTA